MSFFQIAMLCVVAGVALASWENPRGLAWLLVLTVAYLVSSFNWRWHGPAPELVAGLCDAAVCLAILIFGRVIWEMRVGICALGSLFVNFSYLAHNLMGADMLSHDVYSALLELFMLLALGVIGGVSAFVAQGRTDGRSFHPWRTILGVSRPFVGPMEGGSSR